MDKRPFAAKPPDTPNISKIAVTGDVGGFIFTIAVLLILLFGLPEVRWFLAVSAALGLLIAIILRLTTR